MIMRYTIVVLSVLMILIMAGCDTLPLNLPGMTQPPLPVTNPDLLGSWKGTVDQPDYGSYPVTMNITERVGSVDYPSLSCGGSLRLIETRGTVYIFKEKIEYGRGKCSDTGIINVEIKDKSTLDWNWSHPSITQTAHATLVRSDIRQARPSSSEEKGPSLSQASPTIIETESYRMIINSVKKAGNTVTFELTFENITKKFLNIGFFSRGDATYLLSEAGEKWVLQQDDVVGFFGHFGGNISLPSGTKRKTTVTFVPEESGEGNIFTFTLTENSPQSHRPHILRNIMPDQRPKEASMPEPTSSSMLETESYRMNIDSINKSGNMLKIDLTFENLTSNILPLSLTTNPDGTYLLDDIGEKWTQQQEDTAGIFVEGVGIQLAPGAKRRTTVTFVTNESGGGNTFSLVFWEGQPQRGRTHTLHRIRAEKK